ncbi:MAG TPA: aromatic ring-hydroxylating dioxygenase subunit alpha [Chthoniobacterales bacterium]|nr:aromatic ring-hydroxylating dioxygenase subunit alpha [Chthoniobacterales bacterium]
MQAAPAPVFRKTVETFSPEAKTLPQRYYVSAEVFAEEQATIFSSQWACVGHQTQIPRAGDFFLATVAAESLIIVRDQQSGVRAFYNVCRHRGTRMCEETAGHSATIQCPYHAWTYALDGRLVGAPQMDTAPGFRKAEHSLIAANVGVWEGFIFVNLGEEPTPLDSWFAALRGKFAQFNLPNLRTGKRVEYEVRANWKLIFENYSECYHCPGVHPMLSKVSPYDSAENDLTEGPFLGGFMSISKGASLTLSANACARPVGEMNVEDHARVFYYSIFPNMLLSMHPDYIMVHQIWPEAPDRTRIVCDWFFHPDAFTRADFHPEDAVEFWDVTNKQDWHVCELSQQGITSRAYQTGPYSPRESIPAAWDREYLRYVR